MERSFAYGLNFYKLFWIFMIGCFLGVVLETIWCVLRFHHIESRTGLVYGPFNLVYGFGAVIMTVSLFKLVGQRDLWIFLAGTIIGGAYEYICSFIQEKMLGTISWNYEDFPLNLNGRINLLYCFFWGILALLWVRDIYPKMSHLIEKIPNTYGKALTFACMAFMLVNTFMSAGVVYRMVKRQEGVAPKSVIGMYIDNAYPDERVKKIYPNMQFDLEKINKNLKIDLNS